MLELAIFNKYINYEIPTLPWSWLSWLLII